MQATQRLAGAILFAMAFSAGAVDLSMAPSFGNPTGTTAAAQPQLAGVIVEDRLAPFSYQVESSFEPDGGELEVFPPKTLIGQIQSRVVHSIDGSYDFYWRIIPDAANEFPIMRFTVSDFAASGAVNADWRADGIGGAETGEGVFRGSGVDANTYTFDFQNSSTDSNLSTQSSRFLFLDTEAIAYADSARMALLSQGSDGDFAFSGGISGLPTFTPAVPEPETWLLLLAGLGGVIGAVRRRRR